jgi:hypothetical protein
VRFALIAAVTLALVGCSGENLQRLPTVPSPPVVTAPPPAAPVPNPPARPPEPTSLWVVVLRAGSAICVPDARVEIVRGQGLGQGVTQRSPCSYWDPDYDTVFRGLSAGEELTLRASASGYAATEITVVPEAGRVLTPEFIEMSRIP